MGAAHATSVPQQAVRAVRLLTSYRRISVKASFLLQFSVLGLIVTLFIAIGLGWLVSRQMIRMALLNAARDAATTVATHITPEVTSEDFAAPTPARAAAWAQRVGRVVGADIVRVKVWNSSGQVVYSDDPRLLGQSFALEEQEELRDALAGQIAMEISALEKSENVAEQRYGRLLEVYVPVVLPGSSAVVGAYEVYRDYIPLQAQITTIRRSVWGGTAAAFSILFVALFGLVNRASRQLYRLASFPELNPAPIIEADLAGRVTYLNPQAERLFPDLRVRGTQHPLPAAWDDVVAQLQGGNDFLVRETRTGSAIFQEVIHGLLERSRLRVYTVDVTERHQAMHALQESQRMLATLMSNLPGMAYRRKNDPHWTMEFVSDGSSALTGHAPADLVANRVVSYAQLIHPDDREAVWTDVQVALKERRPFQLVYRVRTRDEPATNGRNGSGSRVEASSRPTARSWRSKASSSTSPSAKTRRIKCGCS